METTSRYTDLVNELKEWCRGEGLEETHSLVVLVPEGIEIAQIEETMETIKALGRVRVRGRIYSQKHGRLAVLCECKEEVDASKIPTEVLPVGGTEGWKIVTATSSTGLGSSVASPTENPPSGSSTESVIRVVGDLLAKMEKPSGENSSYRRLRLFSGTLPTPAGEEAFEHWLEHARLMVEESDCSAKEKRRRIMESLKGPALAVVKAVRAAESEVSPAACLEAIESAFGSAETGEDLYFAFRLLQQQPKEKLSDFLRRLELSLTKVVRRGGLPPDRVNRARVEQLLRGAVHSDMMMVQLRLRERKESPPSFLTLLSEIRHEEEYESSRIKLNASVQRLNTESDVVCGQMEIQNLRSEIKELKSMFAATNTSPRPAVADSKEPKSSIKAPASETGVNAEVAILRKQVTELQSQIAAQQSKKPDSPAAVLRVESTRQTQSVNRQPSSSDSDGNFCYRCGENGHFSAKCKNDENQAKVIQKLIRSLRKAKQSEPATQATNSCNTVCQSKKSEVITLNRDIPKGLIGPSSVVPVKINGQPCDALLDSGSQVTIIFKTWYKRHLPNVPIQPVSGLAIWGLSDTSYPYLGYVVVDMEFPERVTGTNETLSVLALICPSPQSPEQTPVILGTNANLFQRLARLCKETAGVDIAQTLGIRARDSTLNIDQSAIEGEEDDVGCVKWMGPGSLKVPPGGECVAICEVELKRPLDKDMLMVEASHTLPLPSGVLLQPMVVPSTAVEEDHLTVLIQNASLRDTIIPVGAVLGQLCPAYPVTPSPKTQTGAETLPTKLDPELIQFGDSPIPHQWKERLQRKLCERASVFSLHEWDVGLAKDVEHHIRLSDPRPFRERSRRLAPADIDDVRMHLQELLKAGIIKESRSPYASPIVIARKKNGRIRMCIDYRTLNSRTVPDQYTTPRIDDALDCLSGSKWFSVLDLRSGYYQIAMANEDKEKTAFICPLGFFQFERMPQGITGAPATFQRLMEKAVGDMNLLQVLVYLDDLIVFGRSLEEHEERLLRVLDRLEEVGLKLSLDKCQFCQPRVKYVGHIVSANGVATDPDKIEAVAKWPRPTDLKSLRSFLGFCGYYRRFIASYSSIVRPLTELTKGYAPTRRGKQSAIDKTKTYFKEAEPFNERWDQSCEDAFKRVIQCLINAPVLAFADANKPYVLHTDASFKGLGAVLYQEHPEGLRPVAFASRKLSSAEQRYAVHQLEFLALKWAVVDKFHDYLYGVKFTVRTDNNPLTYVLTTAKLNATGHRWLAALATYDFDVQYRPGKANIDADLLSRHIADAAEPGAWDSLSQNVVKSICQRVHVDASLRDSTRYVDQLGASPACIPDVYAFPSQLLLDSLEQLSKADLITAQKRDAVIGRVAEAVKQGVWPRSREMDPEMQWMKREFGRLVMRGGLLFRLVKKADEEALQLVLPAEFRGRVLHSLHDDMGHLGVERVTDLIRARFYWPKMAHDVEDYVKNCGLCLTRKTPCQRAAPLHHIVSSGPMDLVCIDFLSMEPDSRGISNVLVVTDHFTRYAQAFPSKNQKALTVARILVEKYFVHYGLPARIHSDQGRDFESRLIRELLTTLGVRKSRTTPYHPQGDPQPERFNRTLLSMLATLGQEKKRAWSQHVAALVHAYNSTKSDATGYSPYFLMFGREARLPVDLCFRTSGDGSEEKNHYQYVANLRRDLQRAYQLASQAADKSHLRNKRAYDQKVSFQNIQDGDRVLLRNLGLKGKHKLESRWSSIPHVVVGKLPNLPVYRVRPEGGRGSVRTIHRDHLLPIGQSVRMPNEQECEEAPVRPRTRLTRTRQRQQIKTQREVVPELTDSSSDMECEVSYRPCREYLERLLTRRDVSDRVSVHSEHEDARDPSPEPPAVESEPDQADEESQVETDPDSSDSETVRQNVYRTPVNTPKGRLSSSAKTDRILRTREKRQIKPVLRLTYDEPGKASEQPLTIVHRGIIIKLGKN